MNVITSILHGDYSGIRFADTCSLIPACSQTSAVLSDSWFKHSGCSALKSVDLSGNSFSDHGVKLIADCLHLSSVQFINLQFNPCRSMPSRTTHPAWLELSRSAALDSKPRTGLPQLPAAQVREDTHSQEMLLLDAASFDLRNKSDRCDMNFTKGMASTTVSRSGCRLTDVGNHSTKRHKGNAVHPEKILNTRSTTTLY